MRDGGGGKEIRWGPAKGCSDKKISQLGPYRGKCELVELCILSIPTPSACAHIHHVNIPTAWPSG